MLLFLNGLTSRAFLLQCRIRRACVHTCHSFFKENRVEMGTYPGQSASFLSQIGVMFTRVNQVMSLLDASSAYCIISPWIRAFQGVAGLKIVRSFVECY